MKHMNKIILWIGLAMILLLQSSGLSQDDFQKYQSLNRGRMWYDLYAYGGHKDALAGSRLARADYPGCAYSALRQIYHPIIPEFPGMDGYMFSASINDSLVLYRIPFRGGWFNPHQILNVRDVSVKNNFDLKKEAPEQEAYATVELVYFGLEMSWRAMVWSVPKYDDFIIWEFTLENIGGRDLKDFRFARAIEISIGANTIDNTTRKSNTEDDYFEWDPEHQVFYFHDGQQLDPVSNEPIGQPYGFTGNDIGEPADYENPATVNHHFQAPQYFTMYWLDKSMEPGEPDHMNCTARWRWPQPVNEPESKFWWQDSGTDEEFMLTLTYDQHPPLTQEDGSEYPAGTTRNTPQTRRYVDCYPLYIFETGPFDIAAGEELTLVMAMVGGHMEWERVANLVDSPDKALENQNHLIDGRDSLFANLAAAQELYRNDYVCPVPPPPPTALDPDPKYNRADMFGNNSLKLTSLVHACKIQWFPILETYKDRDYNVNDVAGYRLYRSKFSCFGPWELLRDITVDSISSYLEYTEDWPEDSMITYMDANLDPSKPLHYVVTAYDTPKEAPWKINPADYPKLPSLESAKNNFNVEPIFARVPADDENFQNTMRVYPNPFKLDSQIPNNRWKMDFVNIPSQCTIRIYTLAGDLINKIEHDEPFGDHEWASTHHADFGILVSKGRMLNQNWQRVVPGIYIYHVESHVPGHKGENKIGKFVIIR
ncbi:hypothetical protein ACFL4L_04820 [bacterium]